MSEGRRRPTSQRSEGELLIGERRHVRLRRRTIYSPAAEVTATNRGVRTTTTWNWRDLNGNRSYDLGEGLGVARDGSG